MDSRNCILGLLGLVALAASASPDRVLVDLDTHTPFEHYWKRSFGSGHATLTLRPDWQAHLVSAVQELGLGGVRHHGLLDDDMGVVVAPGKYNFTKVLQSWEFQVSNGVTPIVELSFMPAILANCTWTSPAGSVFNPGHDACHTGMQYRHVDQLPTDFNDWFDLVRAVAQQAVARFSLEEVSKWRFEVWNEMWGMPFPDAYMKLYNASARAIKSVSSELKVGGPATMQLLDIVQFVQQAAEMKIPFDFVSTHMYPTDPKCPTGDQWGPDCLPDNVKAAKKSIAHAGVPLYLTEYNVGCCIGYPQHDLPGAAAFAFRTIGALDGVTDVLSWWTFTDIFEEGTAVDKHTEYMDIYGLKTVSGVPKPGWRAFQMLHEHAGDQRLACTVSAANSTARLSGAAAACTLEAHTDLAGFDIGTAPAQTSDQCCTACVGRSGCSFWSFNASSSSCHLKNSDAGRVSSPGITSGSSSAPPKPTANGTRVSAWATSSSDPKVPVAVFLSFWSDTGKEPDRAVEVSFKQTISSKQATEYRIDETHANAHATWVGMGSPPKPTSEQVSQLVNASQVVPSKVALVGSTITVTLPANSAVVLVLD